MTTTNQGTIELWYNATTRKMESVIRENNRVIISIPCPGWADKTVLAAEIEKESSRRTR